MACFFNYFFFFLSRFFDLTLESFDHVKKTFRRKLGEREKVEKQLMATLEAIRKERRRAEGGGPEDPI